MWSKPCCLGTVSLLAVIFGRAGSSSIADARPPPAKRTFNSSLVNYIADAVGRSILPRDLGTLFRNCLPNTLDTTVLRAGSVQTLGGGSAWDSFVVTGDIPAMWLRDSMNQIRPYVSLLNASLVAGREDPALEGLLLGVLHRQASSVLVDAYANAFAWWGPKGQTGTNQGDETFKVFELGAGLENAMQDLRIFERKFEVDSLLSVLTLASDLHELAPTRVAGLLLDDPSFVPAVTSILDTLSEMRLCNSTSYTFQRRTHEPTDSLLHGVGSPCRDTGMVRTHFRPSDDAATFAFNIPGNAMAAVELKRIRSVFAGMSELWSKQQRHFPWASGLPLLVRRAESLEASVRAGLAAHGTMQFLGETVFAYEVDGFGNAIFMDDANIPSLLSLPMLGFLEAADPVYLATRRLLLSEHNPWYFKGKLGIGGIGGPHEGADTIWPMSLMVQAWTSRDVDEVSSLLQELMVSSAPNSLMHESFNKDNVTDFTRPWFAWANTLFGDLVLKVASDQVLHRAANLSQPLDLVALIRRWAASSRIVVV